MATLPQPQEVEAAQVPVAQEALGQVAVLAQLGPVAALLEGQEPHPQLPSATQGSLEEVERRAAQRATPLQQPLAAPLAAALEEVVGAVRATRSMAPAALAAKRGIAQPQGMAHRAQLASAIPVAVVAVVTPPRPSLRLVGRAVSPAGEGEAVVPLSMA